MKKTFEVWQAHRIKGADAGELSRTRLLVQTSAYRWQVWWTSFDPSDGNERPDIPRASFYERSCYDDGFRTREQALWAMFNYDDDIGCRSVLIWEGL